MISRTWRFDLLPGRLTCFGRSVLVTAWGSRGAGEGASLQTARSEAFLRGQIEALMAITWAKSRR